MHHLRLGRFCCCFFFFFNDTATTEIYTLSLHDALPILGLAGRGGRPQPIHQDPFDTELVLVLADHVVGTEVRSEEHTSELQSHSDLVCRLLLEKKKKKEIKNKKTKKKKKTKQTKYTKDYHTLYSVTTIIKNCKNTQEPT